MGVVPCSPSSVGQDFDPGLSEPLAQQSLLGCAADSVALLYGGLPEAGGALLSQPFPQAPSLCGLIV